MRKTIPDVIVVEAVDFTITRRGDRIAVEPSTWTQRWWRGAGRVEFRVSEAAIEVETPRWLTRHGVLRFDRSQRADSQPDAEKARDEYRVPSGQWDAVRDLVRAGGWRKVAGM